MLREWSGEWPFVDAFKLSRPWLAGERFGCWDCAGTLDLDAHGWVRSLDTTRPNGGQVANTLVFNDAIGRYASGPYLVLYDGHGTLSTAVRRARTSASAPGRDVVGVDSRLGNFVLRLVATDPTDPLRNIRVLPPGWSLRQRADARLPERRRLLGQHLRSVRADLHERDLPSHLLTCDRIG